MKYSEVLLQDIIYMYMYMYVEITNYFNIDTLSTQLMITY